MLKLLFTLAFSALLITVSFSQTPGGVPGNLQFWLKADAGTNTIMEGMDVNAWQDQSTNGFDAAANTNSTDFPTFRTRAANYNPGIVFDGEYSGDFSDGLHLGANYVTSDSLAFNIFVVCKPDSSDTNLDYVIDFGDYIDSGYGITYNNHNMGYYMSGDGYSNNTQLLDVQAAMIHLSHDQTSSLDNTTLTQNSSYVITRTHNFSAVDTSIINENDAYANGYPLYVYGPFSIGRGSSYENLTINGTTVFNGAVLEVLAYNNQTLSLTDVWKIETYLAIKYGITLPHTYLNCNGDVIKVLDDYYKNIAGIMREDCSALYQKQSKSVRPDAILALGQDTIANTNQENTATLVDGSYLMWGTDGAALNNWNTTIAQADTLQYAIQNRIWKSDANVILTNIHVEIDVDNPNYNLPDLPASSDGIYYIVYSASNNFTNPDGAFPLVDQGGGIWAAVLPSVSGSRYFTIGVSVPTEICDNGIDDNGDSFVDCDDSFCPCCDAQAPILQKN